MLSSSGGTTSLDRRSTTPHVVVKNIDRIKCIVIHRFSGNISSSTTSPVSSNPPDFQPNRADFQPFAINSDNNDEVPYPLPEAFLPQASTASKKSWHEHPLEVSDADDFWLVSCENG